MFLRILRCGSVRFSQKVKRAVRHGLIKNVKNRTAPIAPVAYCSGNPRMVRVLLIELVREFESRRGEILNFFTRKKGSIAESA